ncbi:MAG: transposase [Alkalibacterium sp.]|nr:transposase [Alkalibacterium sp.]
MWNERYTNNPSMPTLSEYDLNILIPAMKRQYAFLKTSDSTSLQQVSADRTGAFKKFFKNSGQFKHPRFKGKHHARQSYTAKNVNGSIRYENGYLRLPKIGFVRFRCGRTIAGKIKRATITLTPSGAFECSVLVEDESQVWATRTHRSVGIDMGVADLMVLSTGDKVATIRYDKRLTGKRTYWEQRVARRGRLAKAKGILLSDAKNCQKAKQQRAKVFQKEKSQRTDRLHKLTTALVRDFDVIVLEELAHRQHDEKSSSGAQYCGSVLAGNPSDAGIQVRKVR